MCACAPAHTCMHTRTYVYMYVRMCVYMHVGEGPEGWGAPQYGELISIYLIFCIAKWPRAFKEAPACWDMPGRARTCTGTCPGMCPGMCGHVRACAGMYPGVCGHVRACARACAGMCPQAPLLSPEGGIYRRKDGPGRREKNQLEMN